MEIPKLKLKFTYFKIVITLLIIIFLSYYINHNIPVSTFATFITWSAYILCIPGYHGAIIIGIPYRIITDKKLLYPEIIVWPTALIFTLISSIYWKQVYQTTIFTHLFYHIISHPWPYWIIIFVSAIATFYRFAIGYQSYLKHKYIHFFIRTLIIIFAIFTFFYISYTEIIIFLNLVL